MKKTIKTAISVLLTAIFACTLCIPGLAASPDAVFIGADKAKSVALEHAGLAAQDATFVTVELDRDDGVAVYEVEFYSGNTEYDYEINAKTGKVLKFDSEFEGKRPPVPSEPTAEITLDEAKAAAAAHAGYALNEIKFTSAKTDYDDGVKIYDIDFFAGRYEFNYEILAADGSVLEAEREYNAWAKILSTLRSIRQLLGR